MEEILPFSDTLDSFLQANLEEVFDPDSEGSLFYSDMSSAMLILWRESFFIEYSQSPETQLLWSTQGIFIFGMSNHSFYLMLYM